MEGLKKHNLKNMKRSSYQLLTDTSFSVYSLFPVIKYLGADASLYNYAQISVNGEYWGVYLALEAVEDSFMLRNCGTQDGELYKPDSMNMGGFEMDGAGMGGSPPSDMPGGFAASQFSGERPEGGEASEGGSSGSVPEDSGGASQPAGSGGFAFEGGGPGGFSLGGGGADLNYTNDNLDSYSTIWEGEITQTNSSDHKRVVTALKNISQGTDLESYMDIDNLLRYMAVHVFSVNEDSLSGRMAHNYYLYEYNGQLNLFPWDYNLAFGGMGGSDATSVVNEAVDNAFDGTDFFDTLMENEAYHEQYYAYLTQLVDEYINGGGFDEFYNRVRSQIDALVEADPTAFYSYEEYVEAVETLYEVIKLRGESISGQTGGTIPSTSAAQSGSDALIDASHIDLEVLGSMGAGGGFGGQAAQENQAALTAPSGRENAGLPELSENSPDGFDASQVQSGLPDDFDASQFEDFASSRPGGETQGEGESTGEASAPSFGSAPGGRAGNAASRQATTLSQYGLSLAVIAIAFLFAVFYRRKPRRR